MHHFRVILGFVIGFFILSLLEKTFHWGIFIGMLVGYLWSQLASLNKANKKELSIDHLDKEGLIKLRKMETGTFFGLSVLTFFSLIACEYIFHYQSIPIKFLVLFVFIMMFLSWSLPDYFYKRIAKKS